MKALVRVAKIGDVEFELVVRDEIKGYYGSWFCPKCWLGGVKYELLPTVDEALTQAEDGALDHYESVHRNNLNS